MHRSSIAIFFVFAVALSCIIGGSLAANATCPTLSAVPNLNIPEHLGNWGIHGLIVSEGAGPDPLLNCLHADLSAGQSSVAPVNVSVSLSAISRVTNATLSGQYAGSIPTLNRPGQWTVSINGTQHALTIIRSDYVEYSLMATCAIIEGVEVTKFLLASRSHDQMPDVIVNNYKSYLAEVGIDTSRYYPVTHGHACHM